MRLGVARSFESPPRDSLPGAPTAPDGDLRLLRAIAGGDATAFKDVVTSQLPHLLASARRILRDQAESEDIAQEALIRLWRNARTLELGPGGLKPWLRRVVANLCIDRIRANRRLTVVAEVPEQAEQPTQFRSIDERESSGRVRQAILALPERQRLALTLFHFDGLSQIEVGNLLGISDEAVESLLARARRTLKAALKNEWQQLLSDTEDGP